MKNKMKLSEHMMSNNNKEWGEELREILIQHPKEIGETGSLEQWLTEFIHELLQKERQRICKELEERFIDIWRKNGAKSKTEYYPTLKMLLDELEAIQKINE